MYWIGQKVRSGFSVTSCENPEPTFWPTNIKQCSKGLNLNGEQDRSSPSYGP